MRPIFTSAITAALLLYPVAPAVSQSDMTCVRYMEADYEYRDAMKRACKRANEKSENKVNCYDYRNYALERILRARRENAYREIYKGPVSKYPKITKRLMRAERRRCRKRF